MNPVNDYLRSVCKPINGNSENVQKMNEMLLAYDPNSPARHDQKLRIIAKMVYEKEDISVSELFRRIISHP